VVQFVCENQSKAPQLKRYSLGSGLSAITFIRNYWWAILAVAGAIIYTWCCRDFEIEDCNGYRLCSGHDTES